MIERLEVQPNARSQLPFPAAGDVTAAVSEILFPTAVIYTAARTGPCSAASDDAPACRKKSLFVLAVCLTSASYAYSR